MPDLIAKSPLGDRAALTIGDVVLAEGLPVRMTSVAPFAGAEAALAAALRPLAFPPPNRVTADGTRQMVWTARDQAFLIGPLPDGLAAHAALTDQSDGWAHLQISGVGSEAVLARLIAIDLSLAAFPAGHVARTPLNHMNAVLIRDGAAAFTLLVFRSMARSAWHEIEGAMQAVAARAALG